MAQVEKDRLTLLDLMKASRSVGVAGTIKCHRCDHVFQWRMENDRNTDGALVPDSSMTPERARALEAGYMYRVLQEVITHYRESHNAQGP